MQGFAVCIRAFIPYIFSDIVFLFFFKVKSLVSVFQHD